MDPLSIASSCIALIGAITKTSVLVTTFVRDVRSARSDLDAVSRELHSLKNLLELLADDAAETSAYKFPESLGKQVAGIVANCSGVIVDIEATLKKHEGTGLKKSAQWVISGQSDMAKLRSSLEAHKSALEIALDMVTLTLAMEIKSDTQAIRNDTTEIKETMKEDTALILAEIARLQKHLPQKEADSSDFMLQRYLDNLTNYAESVCDTFADDADTAVDLTLPNEASTSSYSTSPRASPLEPKQTATEITVFDNTPDAEFIQEPLFMSTKRRFDLPPERSQEIEDYRGAIDDDELQAIPKSYSTKYNDRPVLAERGDFGYIHDTQPAFIQNPIRSLDGPVNVQAPLPRSKLTRPEWITAQAIPGVQMLKPLSSQRADRMLPLDIEALRVADLQRQKWPLDDQHGVKRKPLPQRFGGHNPDEHSRTNGPKTFDELGIPRPKNQEDCIVM